MALFDPSGRLVAGASYRLDLGMQPVVNPDEVGGTNAYDRDIATKRLKRYFERVVRIKLDGAPWSFNKVWRKSFKQFMWIAFALWTALHNPGPHLGAFVLPRHHSR